MRPSFYIKIPFCDHAKALKNKQYGSPHRCLIEAFILLTFGDANLWESILVNETHSGIVTVAQWHSGSGSAASWEQVAVQGSAGGGVESK